MDITAVKTSALRSSLKTWKKLRPNWTTTNQNRKFTGTGKYRNRSPVFGSSPSRKLEDRKKTGLNQFFSVCGVSQGESVLLVLNSIYLIIILIIQFTNININVYTSFTHHHCSPLETQCGGPLCPPRMTRTRDRCTKVCLLSFIFQCWPEGQIEVHERHCIHHLFPLPLTFQRDRVFCPSHFLFRATREFAPTTHHHSRFD